MEIARAWEEEGVKIPAPYSRTIKMIFAPDKRNVEEISFSFALIDPGSQTDYHTHDRPELIYVVSGRGISKCEGEEIEVQGLSTFARHGATDFRPRWASDKDDDTYETPAD